VESEVQRQLQTLVANCNSLKKICKGFNLVDELSIVIAQMQTETKTLRSVGARKTAEDFINTLTELCNQLSLETEMKAMTINSNA